MSALNIITNRPREIIDITDRIALIVRGSGLRQGLCYLFMQHTTAALTLAAQEPGVAMDMLDAFNRLTPVLEYNHQPSQHVPAHILSATIGASLIVPIRSGTLALGEFQKVVLVELDGPKDRQLEVSLMPVSG
ncbi:MAG: secondary thiamine-phosphate synthase enzyme YjbQ [SAR202 cluster bacterium]|jgi:secondary thiamine-phosphate synthase enzyme|nr:secondary thiamine-phosphate synthase enzyme YjbQ [SAR202 cluster bacterium]MDP6713022.1 secondary thiamine-phosphate synthase enzyme YjbQ [SAR202 cluster bacterium]